MNSAQRTILDEIEARLNNHKITNGYSVGFTSDTITRMALEPFKNGDLPAVNFWAGSDELEQEEHGLEARNLTVLVEAYTAERDENAQDLAFSFGAGVVLSLFRHTASPNVADATDVNLGGLVHKISVQRTTPMIRSKDGVWSGILVELEIRYSISVGDFTQICNY